MTYNVFEIEQTNFPRLDALGGGSLQVIKNVVFHAESVNISYCKISKVLNNRQADTTFRVLRLLQANPDITQRELAEQLGVSVSGLNYCLKALMEKGWVKMHNFGQSKNKFGYVYILTPSGMAEKASLTSNFLKRKLDEYESLKNEIESLTEELRVEISLSPNSRRHT